MFKYSPQTKASGYFHFILGKKGTVELKLAALKGIH